MRKKHLVMLAAAVILFYPFYFITVNQFVNLLHPIDKSCERDTDCKMSQVECRLCNFYSQGEAVSSDYNPFCPLPKPYFFNCTRESPAWNKTYASICRNNTCIQVQDVRAPNLILAKNWFEDLKA